MSPAALEVGAASSESKDEASGDVNVCITHAGSWSLHAPPWSPAPPWHGPEVMPWWGGETPALEIVTAAATHGNKTWEVNGQICPLCGKGSGSSGRGLLASCGSHMKQLREVGGSSRHCPKSVETQGLAGCCRQPSTNAFALPHAEGLLPAPACSCGAAWRQGLLQSTFPLCHFTHKHPRCQVTWFSFSSSPRWQKLTTESPLLAAAGEGLEQGASTQPVGGRCFPPAPQL